MKHNKKIRTQKQTWRQKGWYYPSELFGTQWDEDYEKAFQTLKYTLTEASVFTIANPKLPCPAC